MRHVYLKSPQQQQQQKPSNNVKDRKISKVKDPVWGKFAGYAKMLRITQAEFLERLLDLFEQQNK